MLPGRNKRRSLLDVPLWGALLMVCVACLLVFLCTYYWYWHRQSSVVSESKNTTLLAPFSFAKKLFQNFIRHCYQPQK